MPNISSYGSMDKMQKKRASEAPPKKPTNSVRNSKKRKTAMNKPNVRGGMSQSTMRSTPKKRK